MRMPDARAAVPQGLDLDLATVLVRLEQLREEAPFDSSHVVWDRIVTCDIPRLRRYLPPAAIALLLDRLDEGRANSDASARDVMLEGRYGEPTDTYTWELVVDRCLQVLHVAGYTISKAPCADEVATSPPLDTERMARARRRWRAVL